MLDASQLKYLTPDQAERMRAYEVLFSSQGWKFFMELVQQQYTAAKMGLIQAKNWPENRIAAGRMSVLGEILQFEDACENEYTQLVEAARADAEEVAMAEELDYE